MDEYREILRNDIAIKTHARKRYKIGSPMYARLSGCIDAHKHCHYMLGFIRETE